MAHKIITKEMSRRLLVFWGFLFLEWEKGFWIHGRNERRPINKKIHGRNYGCLITRDRFYGEFSLQQVFSQGRMYAGTIGYISREVLKGKFVKNAMKIKDGGVYAECSRCIDAYQNEIILIIFSRPVSYQT